MMKWLEIIYSSGENVIVNLVHVELMEMGDKEIIIHRTTLEPEIYLRYKHSHEAKTQFSALIDFLNYGPIPTNNVLTLVSESPMIE